MKKIVSIACDLAKPSLIILFTLLLFQSALIAQRQIKKGRWFIKHNAGTVEYLSSEQKLFDDAGVLTLHQKEHGLNFYSSLSGPDYGDLSYNNITYEEPGTPSNKNRGFRISLVPVAGIFIRDNLLIGASVKINVNRIRFTTYNTDQRIHSTSLGIGPFVRYYFRGTEKARFFGGLESRYIFTKDRVPTTRTMGADRYKSNNDTDETELLVEPHVGYAWFVGKRWSFELQAAYRYRTTKSDNIFNSIKNGTVQPGYPIISEQKQKSTAISLNVGVGFSI